MLLWRGAFTCCNLNIIKSPFSTLFPLTSTNTWSTHQEVLICLLYCFFVPYLELCEKTYPNFKIVSQRVNLEYLCQTKTHLHNQVSLCPSAFQGMRESQKSVGKYWHFETHTHTQLLQYLRWYVEMPGEHSSVLVLLSSWHLVESHPPLVPCDAREVHTVIMMGCDAVWCHKRCGYCTCVGHHIFWSLCLSGHGNINCYISPTQHP